MCKWFGHDVGLDHDAFVPGRANFSKAEFGAGANFSGAKLGYQATFTGAVFGNGADFSGAAFEYHAKFTDAKFGDLTRFTFAVFASDASFDGATFGDRSSFIGVDFGDNTTFIGAIFNGSISFRGVSKKELVSTYELGGEDARKAFETRLEETEFKRDCFPMIVFARARFNGQADFSDRTLEGLVFFNGASIYRVPIFNNVTNLGRIDFTGAHIRFARPGKIVHWTKNGVILSRLRVLRKIAEETKNHDLERDLYIEERKAERGVYWDQLVEEKKKAPEELNRQLEDISKQKKDVWSEWRLRVGAGNAHVLGIAVKVGQLAIHGSWIAVMGVYWALADYGRSFARPLAWLIASVFFFDWRYTAILAPLMPKANASDVEKYKQALGINQYISN